MLCCLLATKENHASLKVPLALRTTKAQMELSRSISSPVAEEGAGNHQEATKKSLSLESKKAVKTSPKGRVGDSLFKKQDLSTLENSKPTKVGFPLPTREQRGRYF